ncbi:hypothetical protein M407DRAFT_35188 [Tulasnella calospora MUT 4182]|uniref:Uncharacterized protein n=1 Tax=Tulasnella calospora MUT 4182 TaxID=1051891 RepID=A0A0C3Q085_9AGAM|nr:hypothetical protein M407DRAFT_35188 [Tulasnella calospora MUT 4182]
MVKPETSTGPRIDVMAGDWDSGFLFVGKIGLAPPTGGEEDQLRGVGHGMHGSR